MKKALLILLALLTSVNLANAQTGGFNGPSAPAQNKTTVQQALTMDDDAIVVLTGKIINSLGDEKYTFKDETGEVIIEIDDEDWHGVRVTPENTLEIVGEVDKEPTKQTEIEVKSFTVK